MYFDLLTQMKKQLGQIESWFDKAQAYATEKKFDPNLFVSFRLAPDQYALARQVQISCDTLKKGVAFVTGKEAPTHADDEKTIDELRARVKSVLGWLDGFTAKDFEGAATRTVTQPRWEGKTMTGHDYWLEHVTPNFFFHVATTYAILRHNGVPLAKRDYLGKLTQTAPK